MSTAAPAIRTPTTTATIARATTSTPRSIVALDADTGKLRWHYQFTPHDMHDWDSNHVPVLARPDDRRPAAQGRDDGQPQRLLLRARSRDRQAAGRQAVRRARTGRSEIGPDGRPIVLPGQRRHEEDRDLPGSLGRHQLHAAVVRSALRLFFVTRARPARPTSAVSRTSKSAIGSPAAARSGARSGHFGALRAIDPATASVKWELRYTSPSAAGVLSTASGLVFAGDDDGNLMAVDSRTGKALWHYPIGSVRSTRARPTCSTAASTCWCRRAVP